MTMFRTGLHLARPALAILVTIALPSGAAWAELAVSANDGKQLQKGDPTPVTPDSVSVIDMGHYPPTVIGSVHAPASMIGSPNAVAVSRDERFAIVTASQKYDPADPMHPAADDKVSVIDLTHPAQPKLIQTVSAGANASGVSINRAGTLVLVAAKGDDAIYAFRLAGNRLSPAGHLTLDKGAAPTDVAFAPDGRHAYVVAQGLNKIEELAVEGDHLTPTGKDVATGRSPYGAVVTSDGNWLLNTNLGGALEGGGTGTITMVDLKAHRLAASAAVGRTPEHLALSPDGKYVAVVVANGSANVKTAPNYDTVRGILRVFAVGPGTLSEVAHTDSGHWCQGAAWSADSHMILAQCAAERQILVYRFDGHALTEDKAAALSIESRPGSIATKNSR